MLYEGALGNTAKQIEQVVGFSINKQMMRDQFSQKLQSLQVKYIFIQLVHYIWTMKPNWFLRMYTGKICIHFFF